METQKTYRTQAEMADYDLTNPPEEKRLQEGEYEMEVRSSREKQVETQKHGVVNVISIVLSPVAEDYADYADVWAEFWSNDQGLRDLAKFLGKLNIDVPKPVKPSDLDDLLRGARVNVLIKMRATNDGKLWPKVAGFKKIS